MKAEEIEENVNKVITGVTRKYKEEADKAILPFVEHFLTRFSTPEFQKSLCDAIESNLVPQVVDDKVILKPRISVPLTSAETDPESITQSLVWTVDEYYKLAVFHLDNKVKDHSNNTFCIEENREARSIAVNCASVRGDIKFFV